MADTHITIPMARLIELETAEHERDILRAENKRLRNACASIADNERRAGFGSSFAGKTARDALGPNVRHEGPRKAPPQEQR